ncbi:hypothetical protein [Salinimicrobium flavum]|uniref:DUF5017 domain-containing protein n=1 Tax=Salinimicrobium flavum TaxID=1737065 RepID=A0ABW5IVR5_9FLAO
MKKSIYLLMMFAGLVFTSCEPLDDIHDEVDAELDARPTVGTAEFTLTDEDYEFLNRDYGNFDSPEQAGDSIPRLLKNKYPVWGKGSLATVTFDVYNPAVKVGSFVSYEVTEEEYKELGFKYGNFDSADDMIKFLNHKYPEAKTGDAVELTYEYYAGSTSTRTTTYVFMNGAWEEAVTLERADYTAMGESYPNFSSRNDAIEDLSTFLKLEYPYAEAEDTKAVIYALHIGGGKTVKQVEIFTYDGAAWGSPGSVVETTLQFGHDGTAWEPDNTVVYILGPADFTFISDELGDTYDDPAWSAGNYNNFDRRFGNPNYWSDDMLVEAMNILLNEKVAPNAEEGQKYVMVFAIYNGTAGTEQLSLIKQGGVWVRN